MTHDDSIFTLLLTDIPYCFTAFTIQLTDTSLSDPLYFWIKNIPVSGF